MTRKQGFVRANVRTYYESIENKGVWYWFKKKKRKNDQQIAFKIPERYPF